MTKPIIEPTRDTRIRQNEWQGSDLKRRPLAGRWTDPEFENGWDNAGAPYGDFMYRWHADGSLEFKGHVMPGTSGTVVFTLPDGTGGTTEPDYRPDHDVSFLTDIVNGTSFEIARVYIDASTGEVTITYPAGA
jgi:hypothetical protein